MIAHTVILELRRLRQENPEFANSRYLRKQNWGSGERTRGTEVGMQHSQGIYFGRSAFSEREAGHLS